MVLFKSIHCSLNTNILKVKKAFKEKIIENYFFIFYNNINFYKKLVTSIYITKPLLFILKLAIYTL